MKTHICSYKIFSKIILITKPGLSFTTLGVFPFSEPLPMPRHQLSIPQVKTKMGCTKTSHCTVGAHNVFSIFEHTLNIHIPNFLEHQNML